MAEEFGLTSQETGIVFKLIRATKLFPQREVLLNGGHFSHAEEMMMAADYSNMASIEGAAHNGALCALELGKNPIEFVSSPGNVGFFRLVQELLSLNSVAVQQQLPQKMDGVIRALSSLSEQYGGDFEAWAQAYRIPEATRRLFR